MLWNRETLRLMAEGLLHRHKMCEVKCRKAVMGSQDPAGVRAGSSAIKLSWQIIHYLCQTDHETPQVIHADSRAELIRLTQAPGIPRAQTLKDL